MSKRKTTLAKASNKKAVKINPKKGIKKMKENFVIGSRDARLVSGQLKEAKKAKPAVKEVKAVKAVKEVKAEASKIVNGKTQPAVKAVAPVDAVKAVKAQDAVPAQPAVYSMKIGCNSRPVVNELVARMADQKIEQKADTKITEDNGTFFVIFIAVSQKVIRAAFKNSKSKTGYNAPGLAILAAKTKKEAEKEAAKEKKEKEAEKEAKEAAKGKKEGKKENKKSAPKKEDEDADWPTPE